MTDFSPVPQRITGRRIEPDPAVDSGIGFDGSDIGISNDEVFGPFTPAEPQRLVVQPDSPADGRFEILGEGNGEDRRDLVNQLRAIADSDTFEFELTNLGFRIMARMSFTRDDLTTDDFVNQVEAARLAVLNGAAPTVNPELNIEITRPPMASVRFAPGSISFQPGSISFQPGSISFQPGSISFQPGTIVPRPIPPLATEITRVQQVRWEAAMRYPEAPKQVTVAVLDTGIDRTAQLTHPLFAGHDAADRLGGSPDLEVEPRRGVVDSVYGHGTHVAGIVALRAPLATINHESVRRATGAADSFELARDIGDITQADIVVFSFGTSAPSEDDVPVLRAVVRELLSQGKVVVAAAGTEFDLAQPGDSVYPADFDEAALRADPGGELPGRLISVAAVDADGAPMHGSRAGSGAENHVSSYGVGIASAFPTGTVQWGSDGPTLSYDGWARWTGTSMAAPRVAGAIAARFQHSDAATVVDAAAMVIADQLVVAETNPRINAPGIVE